MNDTAKKLREAAEPMRGSGIAAAYAIRLVQKMLDTESTPTFSGNLAAALDVIADELDELQAKADRRRKHVVQLESTIAERNRELRELRGQVPTDREKQILAMWPRFEDGDPVWYGDEVDNMRSSVIAAEFFDGSITMSSDFDHLHLSFGERVKRPVQSVLDADGVEIKVGDTVYEPNGQSGIVTAVHPSTRCVDLRQDGCDAYAMGTKRLTHTRPDSWQRLDEDASKGVCEYAGAEPRGHIDAHDCDTCRFYGKRGEFICEQQMAIDIVRRAKALAGIEVDE